MSQNLVIFVAISFLFSLLSIADFYLSLKIGETNKAVLNAEKRCCILIMSFKALEQFDGKCAWIQRPFERFVILLADA